MRESTRMLLHYVTGLGIVIVGGIHLFTVFLTGSYLQNLAFIGGAYSVISIYKNAIFAVTLELLLVFVDYHAAKRHKSDTDRIPPRQRLGTGRLMDLNYHGTSATYLRDENNTHR